ncbi:MAG: methyltransferase domain-containing protein [Actinobacteria bacterium]|nr:methyltransferase domain-containing protein [Actinomycetota bacterium]
MRRTRSHRSFEEDTIDDHELLACRYAEVAASGDHTATASDFLLRELEIDYAAGFVREGDRILDVGCGMGYAAIRYARDEATRVTGLDYTKGMIDQAMQALAVEDPSLASRVDFIHGSVVELPFADAAFDVVTSHRCLMALLDWELQQAALIEIERVLKPGGTLVLMEGTEEGLERLNALRGAVGLSVIPGDGRDRLLTLKFREAELQEFLETRFELLERRGFGTYYLIGRVIHPLLVAPDAPRYDHPINEVARVMELAIPGLVNCGHLQAYALRKRP